MHENNTQNRFVQFSSRLSKIVSRSDEPIINNVDKIMKNVKQG